MRWERRNGGMGEGKPLGERRGESESAKRDEEGKGVMEDEQLS